LLVVLGDPRPPLSALLGQLVLQLLCPLLGLGCPGLGLVELAPARRKLGRVGFQLFHPAAVLCLQFPATTL